MEITIEWIFGIIFTCFGGLVSFALKELFGQFKAEKLETRSLITENRQKLREEIEKTIAKIDRLEEKLPEKYALKDDFYREVNKLDLKLDNLRSDISELNKNVASLIALTKERNGGG